MNNLIYEQTFTEQRNAQFKIDLINALPSKDISLGYVTEEGFFAEIDKINYFGRTTNEVIKNITNEKNK